MWTEACKAGHGSFEHKALISSFDYAGYSSETALMGILAIRIHQLRKENALGKEEYFGRKLGGFLLSEAIKNSFTLGCLRVSVHTCSLDHKNALKNYIARGMKIFKTEIVII